MKSINQVIILGNATRDPELRYTPQGTAVCGLGVATNRSYKSKEDDSWKEVPEFHSIVFWNKSAEIISQFVKKGDKILVQGRLQTRSWEDKDKIKRYTTEIVADNFVLLSPKKGEKTDEVSQEEKVEEPPVDKTSKGDVNPDEIPF